MTYSKVRVRDILTDDQLQQAHGLFKNLIAQTYGEVRDLAAVFQEDLDGLDDGLTGDGELSDLRRLIAPSVPLSEQLDRMREFSIVVLRALDVSLRDIGSLTSTAYSTVRDTVELRADVIADYRQRLYADAD